MQSKKPRSSNIELLRIYSMFFIIWCHLWDGKVALSGGTFLEHLMASAAGVGAVDIFVLITGYFLINRTEFTLVRFFKILLEVMFWNFVIVAVFVGLGVAPSRDLLTCLFPLAPTKFNVWFVSQYLALILLQPFISRFVSSLTRTQYRALICVMLLLTTEIVPGFPLGFLYSGSFRLSWFITLFLIGGYFQSYGIPKLRGRIYAVLFIVVSLLWSASYLRGWTQIGYNSLLTLGVGILLFCTVLRIDIGSNRGINWVASSTFAAYLIHQNYYLSHVLYSSMPDSVGSGFWPVLLSGIVYMSVLFMAMIVMDKIRIYIFDICHVGDLERRLSRFVISWSRRWLSGLKSGSVGQS